MPRFPETEPEIAALAALVVDGLEQAVEDFPTPPVPADEMQGRLDTYNAARSAAIGALISSVYPICSTGCAVSWSSGVSWPIGLLRWPGGESSPVFLLFRSTHHPGLGGEGQMDLTQIHS